jgi:hypothetical protein
MPHPIALKCGAVAATPAKVRLEHSITLGREHLHVVDPSTKPVLWGLALGLGGAVLVARWLESLLYNVTATDPATYLTVTALLAATALAAAFLPTLSATKIDPVVALRTEH